MGFSKRVIRLEEQEMEREKNTFLQEWKHGQRHKGVKIYDGLSLFQRKLKEHEKKLNDMKDKIEKLNEVTT